MKVKLTTTLKILKEKHACHDGMETLNEFLGEYQEDKPINLLTILESNGVEHCIWALRAIEQDAKEIICLISADFAESTLHIFENKHTEDKRPRNAIKAIRDYANKIIDIRALRDAADAADAVYAGDYGAADAAAAADYAADYAVYVYAVYAVYAADAAADAAAYAYAARELEREKQAEIIKKYLIGDEQ